jgi:uncharacterized coiled-coil protein SlyX
MDIDGRLDRLEVKIDKMSEALSMLARVEEKIHSANGRIDRLEYRADEQERDVDNIKGVVGYNQQHVKNMERFVWLIVSTAVGVASYLLR